MSPSDAEIEFAKIRQQNLRSISRSLARGTVLLSPLLGEGHDLPALTGLGLELVYAGVLRFQIFQARSSGGTINGSSQR